MAEVVRLPTAGKQVRALKHDLGSKPLQRTSRRVGTVARFAKDHPVDSNLGPQTVRALTASATEVEAYSASARAIAGVSLAGAASDLKAHAVDVADAMLWTGSQEGALNGVSDRLQWLVALLHRKNSKILKQHGGNLRKAAHLAGGALHGNLSAGDVQLMQSASPLHRLFTNIEEETMYKLGRKHNSAATLNTLLALDPRTGQGDEATALASSSSSIGGGANSMSNMLNDALKAWLHLSSTSVSSQRMDAVDVAAGADHAQVEQRHAGDEARLDAASLQECLAEAQASASVTLRSLEQGTQASVNDLAAAGRKVVRNVTALLDATETKLRGDVSLARDAASSLLAQVAAKKSEARTVASTRDALISDFKALKGAVATQAEGEALATDAVQAELAHLEAIAAGDTERRTHMLTIERHAAQVAAEADAARFGTAALTALRQETDRRLEQLRKDEQSRRADEAERAGAEICAEFEDVMADMDRRRAAAAAKSSHLRDSIALVTHQVEALRAMLPRKSKSARPPGSGVAFSFSDLDDEMNAQDAKQAKAVNTARDAWIHSSPEQRQQLEQLKSWTRAEWSRRLSTSQFARTSKRSKAVPAKTQAAFLRDAVWNAPFSDDLLQVFKRHAADLAAHRKLVLPLPHEEYAAQRSFATHGRSGAFFSPVRSEAHSALQTHGAATIASRVDEEELQRVGEHRSAETAALHKRIQSQTVRDLSRTAQQEDEAREQDAEARREAQAAAEAGTRGVGVRSLAGSVRRQDDDSASVVTHASSRGAQGKTAPGGGQAALSDAAAAQLATMQSQLLDLQRKNDALQKSSAAERQAATEEAEIRRAAPRTPSHSPSTHQSPARTPASARSRGLRDDSLYASFAGPSGGYTMRSDISGTSSALVLGARAGSPSSSPNGGAYTVRVPAHRGSPVGGFEWGSGAHAGAAMHAGSRPASAVEYQPHTDPSHPKTMKHMLLPFSGLFSHEAPVPVHSELPPPTSRRSPQGGADAFAPTRRRASVARGESKTSDGPSENTVHSTAVWMGLTGARRASLLDGKGGRAVLRGAVSDSPGAYALDMYRSPGARRAAKRAGPRSK